MPPGEPLIQVKDVWKIYQMGETRVEALRGLSLTVHDGEFLAIQGPSGSGKSTAMHIVGCLDIPTRGKVILGEHDISTLSESDLARIRGRKIGFIFQKFNLIDSLTALENVMLPLLFQGLSLGERERRARKVLSQLGLADRLSHKPTELSGGQQQRVAIARALAVDPPVLLADEPTGNLDSATGIEVLDTLIKLNREQRKTVVLVTHDDRLARLADRIAHLRDGKIIKTTLLRKRP